MKFTISTDRTKLTITADASEREALFDAGEEIQADDFMCDFLEPLVCNSELEWILPEETGDLTDAPMLGIRVTGFVSGGEIIERWAFMDYAIRSPLEDLRDKGEAVFVGGDL